MVIRASLATLLALSASPVLALDAQAVAPSYDPTQADQYQSASLPDTVPAVPEARQALARSLAFQATLYGTVAVLEFRQLYQQAVDRADPQFVGFNAFAHGRSLAGPGYKPFKSPNADTLYSNAYLDLRDGPVLFEVPDTAGRYFTANFLDIYGNATNISARLHGTKGGRFLIATTDWKGDVPEGATLFRVTTPLTWILLRVLVHSNADVGAAVALQDRFRLTPLAATARPTQWPDGRDESAAGFMRILDFLQRTCGHPLREDALVHGFQPIGIVGARPFDEVMADGPTRAGIEQGFSEAQGVIKASMAQNGRRVGAWSDPLDIGRYGFNYLYRAAVNTLGTGANVVDENHPFTSFVDAAGERLDGSRSEYRLKLAPPPPARYFWSVTVYDATTRELYPNALGRYLINDRTPGLKREKDGSVSIVFTHATPKGRGEANTLPVPAGPFYVAIRAQGPEEAIRNGTWHPSAIERMATPAAGAK
ncbi:DUF1254 domain-containing protein [Novosphingobium sp. KCTC 2891]|uniref:DUF1254 domain-containing protein n=1 Tax=Novosphingobium sp. KCTC 2891 TaxID=2989730 RepID=UPI0022230545|nr:DUF1254 domain-containing protein [Novosphingobium sp. KCTC 2891]MCW1384921.1 DUF1254 domain-containing protein [Novosphingobium sp. KCTC 2891]